ncbi:GNAT family N-acetyltransferase [Streptomyces sp. ODS28]|uniref:GNAT family N-acetyltransferase n=1 Tax=Streptomyces sp. ODS28 TaxID=3136688 RepID=UPI0031ED5AB9
MADTVIRRAQPADALRLTSLVHASRAYGGPYASILSGYSVSRAYVERECVYLALDAAGDGPRGGGRGRRGGSGGELLGFYALLPHTEPPELDLLFVADAAQGRGIGMLLVDHMREQAREAGLERVTVIAHPPAEGFYLRAGAHRTGTRPASPPAVRWERPELCFELYEGGDEGGSGGGEGGPWRR